MEESRQMWKGYYGKEPFDCRLAILRAIRNTPWLILFTVIGTLMLGGIYYLKNVVFTGPDRYEAVSTFQVNYTDELWFERATYINEYAWNTWINAGVVKDCVQSHLEKEGQTLSELMDQYHMEFTSKVESDLRVPKIMVTSESAEMSFLVAKAVEQTLAEDFPAINQKDVESVQVIDAALAANKVQDDVRVLRAFLLAFVLSAFFTVVLFLLREWGEDSIWVPATLYKRYGLKVVQSSPKAAAITADEFLFEGMQKIAICPVTEDVNVKTVKEQMLSETRKAAKENEDVYAQRWVECPALYLDKDVYKTLREMDGVLLVINAGHHAGRKLEFALQQLAQQNVTVTAVMLTKVDKWIEKLYQM